VTQNVPLAFEDPVPEGFFDQLQEMLSGAMLGGGGFQLKPGDPTTVQLVAGAGHDQAAVSIGGQYRQVIATIERKLVAGAAGVYDLSVTSLDNAIVGGQNTGVPAGGDASFALAITATGVPPVGVARYRVVRRLQWDGAKFTRIDPIAADAPRLYRDQAGGVITAETIALKAAALSIYGADADAQPKILLDPATGQVKLGPGGGTAPDVVLYRSAAGVVRSDGTITSGGATGVGDAAGVGLNPLGMLSINRLAAASTALQFGQVGDVVSRFNVGGDGVVTFGPGGSTARDTNLYRSAPHALKTDDAFAVGGALSVTGSINTGTFVNLPNAGVLNFGGDTNLYRGAADTVKTDDQLFAARSLAAWQGDATSQVLVGSLSNAAGGAAAIQFGSAGDTNLYRASANQLRTDDALDVLGALTKGGVAAVLTSDSRLSDQRTPTDATVSDDKLTDALADRVAANKTGRKHMGASINDAQQTVTVVTPGTYVSAPTPDKVSGLVVPATSILRIGVWLECLSQTSATATAMLFAVHINGIIAKRAASGGVISALALSVPVSQINPNAGCTITSDPRTGLAFTTGAGAPNFGVNPIMFAILDSGGVPAGGWLELMVPAGSYDVELKYSSVGSGGTMEVIDRRVFAEVKSYA
jgi:hypothetical protein